MWKYLEKISADFEYNKKPSIKDFCHKKVDLYQEAFPAVLLLQPIMEDATKKEKRINLFIYVMASDNGIGSSLHTGSNYSIQ